MDILSVLFQPQKRLLGNSFVGFIVPDVVVTETHDDTMTITAFPVENGANISDHAYMLPAKLTMKMGFGGGGSLLDFYQTATLPDTFSPQEIYQKLLALQVLRTPFDVTTGKRHYPNMLIHYINVITDVTSENVLSCTLILTQVNITATQNMQVADKSKMTNGVSTSAVTNTGQKTLTPPNNSTVAAGRAAAN